MKNYSSAWKSSAKPRKQRKLRYHAPLHARNKFLSANLSKELRKKHTIRSITVRKGDKAKIMRGQFKGKTGSIDKVKTKDAHVYIGGVEMSKKDGTKTLYPIHISNIQIIDINLDDKKRSKTIQRKKN